MIGIEIERQRYSNRMFLWQTLINTDFNNDSHSGVAIFNLFHLLT